MALSIGNLCICNNNNNIIPRLLLLLLLNRWVPTTVILIIPISNTHHPDATVSFSLCNRVVWYGMVPVIARHQARYYRDFINNKWLKCVHTYLGLLWPNWSTYQWEEEVWYWIGNPWRANTEIRYRHFIAICCSESDSAVVGGCANCDTYGTVISLVWNSMCNQSIPSTQTIPAILLYK